MQIRLTVVDPLGPPTAQGRPASRDVLVTAPTGTALAAVASALATAVAGEGGTASERGGRGRGAPGGRDSGAGSVVLYAGAERLDVQRCTLGEPPLLDGAVLSLGAPADPEPYPEPDDAPAQLQVVAGPDAGGVHLLHGGQITVGRSADADVPLDDPDVSRVHCAVTVGPDGRVSVADLGSTNGTTLDGARVGPHPVRFAPGALLRIGESVLRLASPGDSSARVRTTPDGEGHVRISSETLPPPAAVPPARTGDGTGQAGAAHAGRAAGAATTRGTGTMAAPGGAPAPHVRGAWHPGPVPSPAIPAQAPAPRIESDGGPYGTVPAPGGEPHGGLPGPAGQAGAPAADGGDGHRETPPQGTDVPRVLRRRGGFGAWARRLAGGRAEQPAEGHDPYGGTAVKAPAPYAVRRQPETWPNPAALLLMALGPGPRLWERGPGHPEALTVRLGTVDRPAPDGSGLLPAVPVTADLREVGALGLAGPRARLAGLARAVLAQLAAAHSPDTLEIVLLSADRARPVAERTDEWSWLGWLPHVRPHHGQDCRLLLAYDHEQAAARTDELLRRLEDHRNTASAAGPRTAGPAGEEGCTGPYTVVVVDGDPGGTSVRAAVTRLAQEGPRAGIHVVCLAETAPASAASPVPDTYEAACAVSPVFRECGAVALLSGDVATALRLMRVAAPPPAGGPRAGATGRPPAGPPLPTPVTPGTLAAVDAVSFAWAERFARALAPLRPDGSAGNRPARVPVPLPPSARLLDELGLARATPASLQARWADAADDTTALGGRAWAVLGAGPRGPVCVDLVADGPHLLIEGPAGSGRTELLRSVVASLAAAERPDRLAVVLVEGRDGIGADGGPGDGLRACTDVPHVTTHLAANDPVRMREFAQSLSAELKRRAELLGRSDFAEWHTRHTASGRVVARRTAASPGVPGPRRAGTGGAAGAASASAGAADLDSPPSSTLRLRPGAARRQAEVAPPLPRLVVVVDDLDALVSPALGAPGRPSAGSVIRALEAVAREGGRLGVHLVAATAPGGRTAQSEPVRRATLRIALDAPASGPDEPAPGRGRLTWPDGRVTAFQGGRVTGRIPRTATQRPTVIPLDWQRMGDPPARRSVRELGNGPTDLALLASALERAAREVSAARIPSLL